MLRLAWHPAGSKPPGANYLAALTCIPMLPFYRCTKGRLAIRNAARFNILGITQVTGIIRLQYTVEICYNIFSLKHHSQWTSRSLPVRVRYGVSVGNSLSQVFSTFIIVLLIQCHANALYHMQYHATGLSGLILGLCTTNERRRYKVTPSLIGWAQT